MLALTLRGLAAHKRRLVCTVLAVLLGVAFMAGSLIFTDTMKASLSGAFADAERSTDALVRGPATIEGFNGTQHAPVDEALVDRVAAVAGVAGVAPRVEGFAQVVGKDGKPVDDIGMGAAPAGAAWTDVAALNPFDLVGRSGTADGRRGRRRPVARRRGGPRRRVTGTTVLTGVRSGDVRGGRRRDVRRRRTTGRATARCCSPPTPHSGCWAATARSTASRSQAADGVEPGSARRSTVRAALRR